MVNVTAAPLLAVIAGIYHVMKSIGIPSSASFQFDQTNCGCGQGSNVADEGLRMGGPWFHYAPKRMRVTVR